jgi:hypothetical protein
MIFRGQIEMGYPTKRQRRNQNQTKTPTVELAMWVQG